MLSRAATKPTCRTSRASLGRAFAAGERHRANHAHQIPNIIRIRRGLSCRHPHKPELSVSRGGARSQERIEDHQHHANHSRVHCFQHTKARSASSSQSQSAKHHEHQQGVGLPKKTTRSSNFAGTTHIQQEQQARIISISQKANLLQVMSITGAQLVRRGLHGANHVHKTFRIMPESQASNVWFSRTVRRQHHVHQKGVALQETPKAK